MSINLNDSSLLIKYIQLVLAERLDTTIQCTGIYDELTHIGVKKYLTRIDPRLKYLYTDVSSGDNYISLTDEGISYLMDFVITPKRLPSLSLNQALNSLIYNDQSVNPEYDLFKSKVYNSVNNDSSLWEIVPKEYITQVKVKVYYYYIDSNSRCIYITDNGQNTKIGVDPNNWYDSKYDYTTTIKNNNLYEYIENNTGNLYHTCILREIQSEYKIYDISAISVNDGVSHYSAVLKIPSDSELLSTTTSIPDANVVYHEPGYWYSDLLDSDISSSITRESHIRKFWIKDCGNPQSSIEDVDHAQELLLSLNPSSNYYPEIYSHYSSTPEIIELDYDDMTSGVINFQSLSGVPMEKQLGYLDPTTEELFRKSLSAQYLIK